MPDIPDPSGASPRKTAFDGAPPMVIDAARRYTAEMVTTKGTLTIALDPLGAPMTTNNFVFLSRWHYYDGIAFHRLIPGFVIQAGDPTGSGSGGPGYRFADELPKPGRYEIGSLAMANAGPDTNGSQFFIISGAQGVALPPKYSLFGKVVAGLDVVSAIEAAGTSSGAPTERVEIERVTITDEG